MVVPGNSPGIQQDIAIEAGESAMDNDAEHDADNGSEMKEVRKLQELVRRLEIQNQQLRIKRNPQSTNAPFESGIDNHITALNGTGVMNSLNIQVERGDLQMSNLQTKLAKINTEKENMPSLRKDAQGQYEMRSDSKPISKAGIQCVGDNDSCFLNMDMNSRRELEGAMDKMLTLNSSGELENILDETALDEVEILELGSCSEDEEDCWLYISPQKITKAEQEPESPLKWCRQVLDYHSPETEAACQTLIGKLDQGLSVHSALSSQSSVDSELSTSDDSISMGYKLQDLTDVQVMARLQEESLRQDYASSSASVSRRSSTTSLHSLRRGTYSDQEFDTYSLEDEDEYDCSLSYRSTHRYSPSPLSSPRCQSPSATGDNTKATTSRIRPPRRSVQNHVQDRLKYPNSEDDLRHSMPNLAKTSLRSLEAMRSSRSLESDLQVPSSRLTRIPPPSNSTPPSKLRYGSGSGQSPLTVRQPIKAGVSASSLLTTRQPIKSSGYNSYSSGVRKIQPSAGLNPTVSGAVSRISSLSPSVKHSAVKSQTSVGSTTPKSKMIQPTRRSLQSSKTSTAPDDTWREGCY
ncbi:SLAIN motif-containing protein-like isoform X2 [Ascaphus truei]|uniref:SLAIN motif-containing protein-like isoform X2 n=1 Tax=Ascaphus truei TaxID=8439 RepID=UPI003F597666